MLIGVFFQSPRSSVVDEGVGCIGQFHDQSHRARVITLLVRFCDFFSRSSSGGKKPSVMRVLACQSDSIDEACGATGEVNDRTHQLGIDFLCELSEVEVDVVQARTEFAGVIVSQVGRIQMLEVLARPYLRPLALGHFFAIDGEKAMDVNEGREGVASRFEDTRPEEGVEVGDVLADEMMDLGVGTLPPVLELFAVAFAPLVGGCDVSDRGIEPYIPIVAGAVGNRETKIRLRS